MYLFFHPWVRQTSKEQKIIKKEKLISGITPLQVLSAAGQQRKNTGNTNRDFFLTESPVTFL